LLKVIFNLPKTINNDAWHHVVVVLNRLGSLNTYVDGEKVTSMSPNGIGAFLERPSGLVPAVLQTNRELKTFSDNYTGLLDEFTFWNSARPRAVFT
jgi:hypothetical protein